MKKYVVIHFKDSCCYNLLGVFSSLENAAKSFVEYTKSNWENSGNLWETYCDKELIYLCLDNNQDIALNYILEKYYETIYNEFLDSNGAVFDCSIYEKEEDKLDVEPNI